LQARDLIGESRDRGPVKRELVTDRQFRDPMHKRPACQRQRLRVAGRKNADLLAPDDIPEKRVKRLLSGSLVFRVALPPGWQIKHHRKMFWPAERKFNIAAPAESKLLARIGAVCSRTLHGRCQPLEALHGDGC
jgi:hypothetical protein